MSDRRESVSVEMMRLAGRVEATKGHERILWRKRYHAEHAEFLALTEPVDEASRGRLKAAIRMHKSAARYGKHEGLKIIGEAT